MQKEREREKVSLMTACPFRRHFVTFIKMSDGASSQYILIKYSEYERLRTIEKKYETLQKEHNKHLLIPTFKGKGEEERHSSDSDETAESIFEQIGSGSKRKLAPKDKFIDKVAELVSKRLNPITAARPVNSSWSNFDLSPPSTSIIGSVNTSPPLHFDQKRMKNDQNDSFGNNIRILFNICKLF